MSHLLHLNPLKLINFKGFLLNSTRTLTCSVQNRSNLKTRPSNNLIKNFDQNNHGTPLIYQLNLGKLFLIQCRSAGHSKWQNIRHTKQSKDSARSQLFNKLCMNIRKAVRQPGGGDPHLNKELNDILAICKRVNMPNETIERNIKSGLERKASSLKVEIIGPNNCMLVIDMESFNVNTSKKDVKKVLKKHAGWGFANEGRSDFAFRTTGLVKVAKMDKNGSDISYERAEEIAIEAEAEEVVIDEEENTIWFLTDPLHHSRVRNYIEENTNFEVLDSGVEMLPNSKIELSDEQMKQAEQVIETLEKVEGVVKIYDNIL